MKTAWLVRGKRAVRVNVIVEMALPAGRRAIKITHGCGHPYCVDGDSVREQKPLNARSKAQLQRAERVLAVLSDDWILIHDLASKLNSWSCGVWQTCASLARDGKLTMEYVEGLWKWRVKK
jgi:hypothetical protein